MVFLCCRCFGFATTTRDLKMHLVRLCATSSSSSSSVRSLVLPVLESLWPCSLARLCLPPSSSTNSRALVDLTSCDRFSFASGWGFGSSAISDNSLHTFLGKNTGVEDSASCKEEQEEETGAFLVQRMMSVKDGEEEGLDHNEGGSSSPMGAGLGWGPGLRSPDGGGGGGGGSAADGDDGEKNPRMERKKRKREGEWFRLTDSCSLVLHQGDITKWSVDGETDAIVNAANEAMLGGGGVDGAIHRAAGSKLLAACYAEPEVTRGVRCPTGSAVITRGFDLPASKVVHTVGPIYESDEISAELLAKAYRSSMDVASKAGVKYIAFPAISCGVYGYPYKEAAKIAIATVQETSAGLSEVHFVLFLERLWKVWLAEAERRLER